MEDSKSQSSERVWFHGCDIGCGLERKHSLMGPGYINTREHIINRMHVEDKSAYKS